MRKKDKDEDIAIKIVINQFENEIARLNNTIKELNEDIDNLECANKENTTEIISLKSIIKELRSYVELVEILGAVDNVYIISLDKLKSILDKANI